MVRLTLGFLPTTGKPPSFQDTFVIPSPLLAAYALGTCGAEPLREVLPATAGWPLPLTAKLT
ncbi:MAG: hypothetical protein IPK82_23675 [Polyangiaceae bacterium]|nr:hypothetical protein [Polyangiaceae bacterium]